MTTFSGKISRAEQLVKAGRHEEAAALLLQLHAADSSDIAVLRLLVSTARLRGKHDDAIAYLKQLQAIDEQPGAYEFDLAMACLHNKDPESALMHLERADKRDPDQVAVLLHRAFAFEQLGNAHEATVLYKRCWLLRLNRQAAFDALPPVLKKLALHGRAFASAELSRTFDALREEIRRDFGSSDLGRVEKIIAAATGNIPQPKRPALKSPAGIYFPELTEAPFHDPGQFPWIRKLESLTDAIRDEYLALGEDDAIFNPYVQMDASAQSAEHWRAVNNSRAWNSFHLYRLGKLNRVATDRCPTTMDALADVPLMHVPDHGPEAIFSVLKPATHIPPHHGMVGGRLLVHLPLIVPENCGALRVGGVLRTWETGRCLVFDDTYAHEAWNNSDETRVVMIFDIWHPEISEIEKAAYSRVVEIIDRLNNDAVGRTHMNNTA